MIREIHQSAGKFCLAITGGGSSAISELLSYSGASNTILDAAVPYSAPALTRYVGGDMPQACSGLTARRMAMAAYLKARQLDTTPAVYGIGATAAIATNRDRKGSDRIFVALQSSSRTLVVSATFSKALSRQDQEEKCKQIILRTMAFALGLLAGKDEICPEGVVQEQVAPISWQHLLDGSHATTSDDQTRGQIIFPGAFNPPHEGHFAMQRFASEKFNKPVSFEISTRNVDKLPLDYIDMAERESLLQGQPLVFTQAPTFIEKAKLFPACTFVVGVDTITRIADQKYYQHSAANRDAALAFLASNGHRFLVFGRKTGTHFEHLEDVELPAILFDICMQVDEQAFRIDASSSALRRQTATDHS